MPQITEEQKRQIVSLLESLSEQPEDKSTYEEWWDGNWEAKATFLANGEEYLVVYYYDSEERARKEFPLLLKEEKHKKESC